MKARNVGDFWIDLRDDIIENFNSHVIIVAKNMQLTNVTFQNVSGSGFRKL